MWLAAIFSWVISVVRPQRDRAAPRVLRSELSRASTLRQNENFARNGSTAFNGNIHLVHGPRFANGPFSPTVRVVRSE